MAQEQSNGDEEWLEMPDCQICNAVGSTCGSNCKNIVSLIVKNATTLFGNDDEDTSNLSVVEKLKRMEQLLNEDDTHQQYREHDLSGVCANVTTDLPQVNEQEPDDLPGNPPQDDQLQDLNIPGIEEMIANMQINAEEDEAPELLQSMLQQYSIDASNFHNDEDKAMYIINAMHCVYNRSKKSHPAAEVMNRMNYMQQFIQPRIGLDIPENITATLYKIFASSDKDDDDDDDDAVDNAETFDLLGPAFGQAYRILIGQNMDEENDNNNDETDDGNLADGNSDIEDDDDSDYYSEQEDTSCGSWEWGDDDDSDDDEDSVDSEAEEEEVENERSVRRRQN